MSCSEHVQHCGRCHHDRRTAVFELVALVCGCKLTNVNGKLQENVVQTATVSVSHVMSMPNTVDTTTDGVQFSLNCAKRVYTVHSPLPGHTFPTWNPTTNLVRLRMMTVNRWSSWSFLSRTPLSRCPLKDVQEFAMKNYNPDEGDLSATFCWHKPLFSIVYNALL